MLKNEISIQKILPTIKLKTFSGSFLRRGTEFLKKWMRFEERSRWRNSFLNPSTKNLALEWDSRDIDGATHFQGMAMKF